MIIKAIETAYKGYRFRSRLEARWAVFFDEMGIDWIYEPEGYTDGEIYYLPDFYMPQVNMYAEVKPIELSEQEIAKAELLVEATGAPLLMLVGQPAFINYNSIEHGPEGTYISFDYSLVDLYLETEKRFPCCNHTPQGNYLAYGYKYYRAVTNARCSRFEHGETP